MFRFESPEAFYFLLLIPVWFIGRYWSSGINKSRMLKLGESPFVLKLASSLPQQGTVNLLFSAGMIFISIAWANPQWGTKKERVQLEKSDIFIALDISQSMNAQDASPSRLEKAKRFMSQLVQSRKGDRIGLIFFAGNAFVQMPMTHDYAATEMFIRSADTEMAGTQGTVISEAITMAMQNAEDDSQRALIIISDGEDHDEEALKAATQAAKDGWQIFTVGVGTPSGSLIPVNHQGREEYKMDKGGNLVTSIPNMELLNQLANQGGGQFFNLNDDNFKIIQDLSSYLDMLKKRSIEVRSYTEYNSYYQYFLAPAFLFFVSIVVFPFGYFKI